MHADPHCDHHRPPVGAMRHLHGGSRAGKNGLTPWEYGIAKLLSDAGYATSCWGKWHLGDTEGRLPTDQGFDEWWGYRNSVDEAGYGSYAAFREAAKAKGVELPKLWEGKKGEKPVATGNLDLKSAPAARRDDRREGQ